MNTTEITRAFERIGAKIEIDESISRRSRWVFSSTSGPSINVRNDIFSLRIPDGTDCEDIRLGDIQPGMRHLLLKIQDASVLCGHDERHWFAASVPGAPGGVKDAMEHLKPVAVREAERMAGVSGGKARKRRNAARKRQGEWFFIPRPDLSFGDLQISRNELLQRNAGSKAHVCEEMVTPAGETVMVNIRDGKQLSVGEYNRLPADERKGYSARTLTSSVFVRGAVRHPDHATLTLNGWHEVMLSAEGAGGVGQIVAFLD